MAGVLVGVRPDRLVREIGRVRRRAEVVRAREGEAVRTASEQDGLGTNARRGRRTGRRRRSIAPCTGAVRAEPRVDDGTSNRAAVVEVDDDQQVAVPVMRRTAGARVDEVARVRLVGGERRRAVRRMRRYARRTRVAVRRGSSRRGLQAGVVLQELEALLGIAARVEAVDPKYRNFSVLAGCCCRSCGRSPRRRPGCRSCPETRRSATRATVQARGRTASFDPPWLQKLWSLVPPSATKVIPVRPTRGPVRTRRRARIER